MKATIYACYSSDNQREEAMVKEAMVKQSLSTTLSSEEKINF